MNTIAPPDLFFKELVIIPEVEARVLAVKAC
jgi:hypothetical protein